MSEKLFTPGIERYVVEAVGQLPEYGPFSTLGEIFDLSRVRPQLYGLTTPPIKLAGGKRGFRPLHLVVFCAAIAGDNQGYIYRDREEIFHDLYTDYLERISDPLKQARSRSAQVSKLTGNIAEVVHRMELRQETPSPLLEDVATLRSWIAENFLSRGITLQQLWDSLWRYLPANRLYTPEVTAALQSYQEKESITLPVKQRTEHVQIAKKGVRNQKPAEKKANTKQALKNGHLSTKVEKHIPEDSDIQEAERFAENPDDEYWKTVIEDKFVMESPVALYLIEISRVPLLTAEEEISLAKAYEAGREAEKQLRQELLKVEQDPVITENLELSIQSGKDARKRMIESNLRLVVSIARKYMNRGIALLDLVQEGNIGLQRAVEKYDWRRGFRFSTYAYWWIRQAVSRAIVGQTRTIREPIHVGEALSKFAKTSRELTQTLGRDPTREELALAMDVFIEKIDAYKTIINQRPISLDMPVMIGEETTLGELQVDINGQDPTQEAEMALLREKVDQMLSKKLTPREKRVLKLRHGLVDGVNWTLDQVGKELGVTRERVRQIEEVANEKLRTSEIRVQFSEYLE